MNILVPLNDLKQLEKLIEAGADEFYSGFYDDGWTAAFGDYADINRMTGFKRYANSMSFEEIKEACKIVKSHGKKFFVTLNANAYTMEERTFLKHYLKDLSIVGVDGIILSEMGLAKAGNEFGLDCTASTMCCVYNSDISEIYLNHGFKRVIIPRDVSLKEIEEIIKRVPDIEYEVFLMRNGCRFSDGYCLGTHRIGTGALCAMLKKNCNLVSLSKDVSFETRHELEMNNFLYQDVFRKEACGLCALYRLNSIGVSSLKIVGRADGASGIIRDVSLVRKNLEIAADCKTEKEYLNRMIFPDNRRIQCKLGYSCYYPEVRFGNASL